MDGKNTKINRNDFYMNQYNNSQGGRLPKRFTEGFTRFTGLN